MSRTQREAVYHSTEIQAWEKRWFGSNNSSYGLMQQAALFISQNLNQEIKQRFFSKAKILVWCGQGNNAGDGYLVAVYLKQLGFDVSVYAASVPKSTDALKAYKEALDHAVTIENILKNNSIDIHIDALFGIGLNRDLDHLSQQLIQQFNAQSGFKVAIDIPSGLHPNTGMPLPIAVHADLTYCLVGLKAGLLTGQAGEYIGRLQLLPLIPKDQHCKVLANYQLDLPNLVPRKSHHHKGSFGHVLVIGGHPNMGGAVMMSAEAAIHSGAGKVTVLCDVRHHQAILSRSPNIMVQDVEAITQQKLSELIVQIDTVCFGMGLGRDDWAKQQFIKVISALNQQRQQQTKTQKSYVFDADALWFLRDEHANLNIDNDYMFTPHAGEAARLLGCTAQEIEIDRVVAIKALQEKYAGQWVLKGAGSLILEYDNLVICGLGNAGMGTAGMGDVLAGMIAGLKGQFQDDISLADIVVLHAAAGDELAKTGMRGIQAHDMPKTIYKVINSASIK